MWQSCGAENVWRLFFNAAFGNHDLHGILSTAPVHVRLSFLYGLKRPDGIGEKQCRGGDAFATVLSTPISVRSGKGTIRSLCPLPLRIWTNFLPASISPTCRGQGFFQTQSHGVGRQKKNSVTQLACRTDQHFNLRRRKDIRYAFDLRRLYDVQPLPFFFENIFSRNAEALKRSILTVLHEWDSTRSAK